MRRVKLFLHIKWCSILIPWYAGSNLAEMEVGLWVALAAFLLALLYDFLRRRPIRNRKQLNLPPGPPGIPVLGNLLLLSGPKLPHDTLADLSKQYGPIMFLRLGSKPCIVATSPEVCRIILKDEDRVFASRPTSSGAEHLLYQRKAVIFAPLGERWRQLRKAMTVELLTQKRIDEFESLRVEEASALVRAMHHHVTLYGAEKPIDVRDMLKALTFNFTSQLCCSKRFFEYDCQDPSSTRAANAMEINPEEAKEFAHLFEELNFLVGAPQIGDFIPYLSFLDWFTGYKPRMIKTGKRIDEFLGRLLEQRRKHPSSERASSGAHLDFLDVLLGLPGENGSDHMDDTVIKAICLDVLAAGTLTSSSSLEWIMSDILRNPDIAARLSAELDAVVGKERLVTESDITNLPYLQSVVKEGMRLHPTAPLLVPRESLHQSIVMGYDIPKGTIVFTNVWAVHRDPAVWDNPMEFRPDRFLNLPDIDMKGQHYQFLPFGSGRRGCPGMGLGLTIVQYALARLLQAFDWSLPNGMKPEDLDIEESSGTAMARAHALQATATTRLSPLLY